MNDPEAAFIAAATWHGPLEAAEALRSAHPGLPSTSLHVAAILGDEATVRRLLAADPSGVHRKAPPYGADPLNLLGLSKYLRLDSSRSGGFLGAARALLDAGADPNTGFWHKGEFETALYGAAGVAHHEALTRLLLERGADPNDEEVVYHSPETYDLGAMQAVVGTGRVTPEHLALMLMRKLDWHDHEGVRWLLQHGAIPPDAAWKEHRPLAHAIARDNHRATIALLLDHGADPAREAHGVTGVQLAARHGRGDLLALFRERGHPMVLADADRLLAACALDDRAEVERLRAGDPAAVAAVLADGGRHLCRFTGSDNAVGVRSLLSLGVPVDAAWAEGDGYWDVAPNSQAIHVAAWRAWRGPLGLLIERGAPVNARDGAGRTPLMLAIRATVDSYWVERRTPDQVRMLLDAGARPEGVTRPCAYADVEALLAARGG